MADRSKITGSFPSIHLLTIYWINNECESSTYNFQEPKGCSQISNGQSNSGDSLGTSAPFTEWSIMSTSERESFKCKTYISFFNFFFLLRLTHKCKTLNLEHKAVGYYLPITNKNICQCFTMLIQRMLAGVWWTTSN